MASPFPERGLTGDLYLPRPRAKPKPRTGRSVAVAAAVLGFVAVLLLQMVPEVLEGDAASTQETDTEQGNDAYLLAVHMLNHTGMVPTGTGTLFTFDSGELPFDFSELEYGEFRGDTEFVSRYYAGMGLLARAEGQSASVRFLEASGKPIEQIAYQGQPLIVLNGWETVSKDSKGKVIDDRWGSMQIIAYDWRDGLWCPETGIMVEHPANVTISSASLCLMVYEPGDSTEIPEFGPLFVCVVLAAILVLARRRKS